MIEAFQAFDADVQKLPQWVQIWMDIIAIVLVITTVTLLVGKLTRPLGLYVLGTAVATLIIMISMHAQMGMVRLLGVVHIVFWTPMIIYIWRRLRNDPPGKIHSAAMAILMIVCFVALVFDYYDVARYLFGQRAPIV